MKKIYQTLSACLIALVMGNTATAQTFTTVTVQDSISTDTHWTCDKQYLLMGYVYVTNGTTLTIDPGVIIRGDKQSKGSLIVERGAKLMAMGTPTAPIVFTSNQAVGNRSYGDWGGVILCGKSPNNWNGGTAQVEGGPRSLYGGTDPHDNSGEMHYVRIEFPGVAFSPNNEINGLTFCSVGDATQIDHIQVSYSGDDSYEWFGGTVNTKNLVAFAGWDDDFDTDNGYSGMNQYGIGLRDPYAADQSGSKAFESDSYQSGTKTGLAGDTSGLTKCVFANYTVVGPLIQPGSTAYDPQFVAAAHIRRGSSISILNSALIGYPAGVLIDESDSIAFGSTIANLVSNRAQFQNNAIAGIQLNSVGGGKEAVLVYNGARSLTPTNLASPDTTGSGVFSFAPWSGPWAWLLDPASHNKIYANEQNGLRIQNPFSLTNPDFTPTSTSPIAYNTKALPSYMTTGGADPFHNGKLYPYDPSLPINTDTSALFAHYNAPNLIPNLTSNKLQNSFFTAENHIGAQNFNTPKWTAGWTNFDPNNTNYNTVCSSNAVTTYEADKLYLQVSPNPTRDAAVIGYALADNTDLEITLVDILGNNVRTLLNEKNVAAGKYAFKFETADLGAGVYFVNVTTPTAHSAIKLAVTK